ncbi:MAG: energy transducer TonB [Xanthomonadaceae bacterium]|nr:energy transducer TonB [Xanthomonadaceae bacterium]
MATPDPQPNARSELLPAQLWKWLLAAFAAGLLLFLLVWLKSRQHYDFYKADGSATTSEQTALPAPLPPDLATDTASGLRLPSGSPILPAPPPAPAAAPRPVASTPPPVAAPAAKPSTGTDAVPERTPAPRYPQDALRRGVGGTARVRVEVAADGSVAAAGIAEGSGNRELDRAALEAVRRWHFQPATRNGQAVASEAIVPIVFAPGG